MIEPAVAQLCWQQALAPIKSVAQRAKQAVSTFWAAQFYEVYPIF